MKFYKLLGLFLFCILASPSAAQVFSLADNECAAPCWKGLIAGESTAAEAASIASIATGEFDEQGFLVNGIYEIESSTSYTRIEIRAGIVDKMSVMPAAYPNWPVAEPAISMRAILAQLGQPDFVHQASGYEIYNGELIFSLIYLEPRLRVHFYEPRESIHDGFHCELPTIQDDLYVLELYFYSERAANELQSYRRHAQRYPALLGYPLFEQDVPLETWQAILNGEIAERCIHLGLPIDRTSDRPIQFGNAGNSLFAEDTCAPPCWFGITVGESTESDLEVFIEEQSGFFVDWQYLREVYSRSINRKRDGMYWGIPLFYPREDRFYNYYPYSLAITLDEAIVRTIRFRPNRIILLGDAFANYGNPDAITMNYSDLPGYTSMRLYYRERGLILDFESSHVCNLNTMSRDFWLTEILYAELGTIILPYWGDIVDAGLWEKALSYESFSCSTLALEAMRR